MKMLLSIGLGALALVCANSAGAEGLRHVRQSIFGMDCAPCAYGVEKGLRALPGVQQVTVSLNEGYAEASLVDDSATTLAQIRESVRNNGFTPKQAAVRVEGRYSAVPSPALRADGTTYALEFEGPAPDLANDRRVVVSGIVAADEEDRIAVERIEPLAAAK